MVTKKPRKAEQPPVTNHTNISNSHFSVESPPTNEHDVAAVVAMSEAVKELAIAMQKIAETSKGRATTMTAPMVSIGETKHYG